MKEAKQFRKRAKRAKRIAQAVSDAEISETFLNLAKAYRSQADVLKAKEKLKPKQKPGKRRKASSERRFNRLELRDRP
ncbi:hypothetical protein [Bradyrhizobium neotropicale]|uniref:hypothetical protein n=1 Tax=Bradyrhizobium neotropicale TaxID=1497615 RepID=UPI001AD64D14|nr:hypothetical protein [Bradyrhizobium neotropicale]MBO4227574.1 hypothetical protein [Bradyrhizobium neotropicale]